MRNIDNAVWDTLNNLQNIDSLMYRVKRSQNANEWKIYIRNQSNTRSLKLIIGTDSTGQYVDHVLVYHRLGFSVEEEHSLMHCLLYNLREPNEMSTNTETSTSSG
jgi:hypothetical protein